MSSLSSDSDAFSVLVSVIFSFTMMRDFFLIQNGSIGNDNLLYLICVIGVLIGFSSFPFTNYVIFLISLPISLYKSFITFISLILLILLGNTFPLTRGFDFLGLYLRGRKIWEFCVVLSRYVWWKSMVEFYELRCLFLEFLELRNIFLFSFFLSLWKLVVFVTLKIYWIISSVVP
jgi:hypothetical protein